MPGSQIHLADDYRLLGTEPGERERRENWMERSTDDRAWVRETAAASPARAASGHEYAWCGRRPRQGLR